MSHDSRLPSSTTVAIVGAGPVGLSLALGLARQGVRSVVLEGKRTTSQTSRAPGLHVRTREVFRQWGVEDRFLAAGKLWQPITMNNVVPGRRPLITLDMSEHAAEADRPGVLILEQSETERLLLEAVRESGLCAVNFETEAIALEQNADGAQLTIREGAAVRPLHAEFVVGCDGASGFVRGALGLPFEGMTYSLRPMLADIEVADQEVSEWTARLLGPGPARVVWASRFRIHVRSSPRFRIGRVLLAGDAAHVHSPAAGLGMNGGIHDAHNLAWKLATALRGGDTERLLDSYEVERRAVVVETTSRYTDRLTRIFIEAPPIARAAAWVALRAMMRLGRVRRRMLRRTAMIDAAYPASPLLKRRERAAGGRLPNPLLRSPDGRAVRLYDLLPNAPVLLDVAEERAADDGLPVDQVIRIGPGGYEEPTGLLRKLLGRRDGWILVRPDAHIAWARHRRKGMEAAVRHALGLGR